MTSLLSFLVTYLALSTSSAQDDVFKAIGKSFTKEFSAIETPVAQTISYIGSSQCANVKKILGVTYDQLDQNDKEPNLNSLKLEYRDNNIRLIYNITAAAQLIPVTKGYNPKQKLYIFVHGFTDDPSKDSFRTISDALFKDNKCNVLALDASSLIRWFYIRASTYVRFIGEKLGEVLTAMVQSGADPASIHIIGHSLGAHISGFTGKRFNELTGQQIGRISGLDPAGPCFSHIEPELRLKASDAAFVDVTHTDDGVYGLQDTVGHVDYYPNGGSEQPNCLFQTCSHSRSWHYYSESVVNATAFPAIKCEDWNTFKTGKCNSNEISYMGFPSKPDAKGKYILQTRDESPFGLGEEGLRYKSDEGVIKKGLDVAGGLFG